MSEIATERISISTTGEAGSATGSATSIPITGFLLDVFIDYDAAAALNGLYDLVPLNSALTITVEGADELDPCVTVTLRWLTP